MRYAELVRKLSGLGFELRRQAGGSHEVWWLPGTGRQTVIPRHGGKDLGTPVTRKILRDLGLNERDLEGR